MVIRQRDGYPKFALRGRNTELRIDLISYLFDQALRPLQIRQHQLF
jgi:hypothetical protein